MRRTFIKDEEGNPFIYKGLPLRTEYRFFVDFDRSAIIGVSPYWEPGVMKQRFGHESDADSPHNLHDYIIYQAHEDTLMGRYKENVGKLADKLMELILEVPMLEGQWSIDVMQNGADFFIIDMALACESALRECIPESLRDRRDVKELQTWIPEIPEMRAEEIRKERGGEE